MKSTRWPEIFSVQRPPKDERITAGPVMRFAVRLFIDHYRSLREDVANTEEELYELAKRKLKLK